MAYGSGYAELYALLVAGNGCQESTLVVIVERTAQSVAQLVAKGRYAGHAAHVGLHGQLVLRIGTRTCRPAFAVYYCCRIFLIERCTYLVHRLYVMNAHEVEAETVDVIFLNPI